MFGVEGMRIDQCVVWEILFVVEDIFGWSSEGLVVSLFVDWCYQIKRLSFNLGWCLSNWIDWLDEFFYFEL